jgi:hypothetical protein
MDRERRRNSEFVQAKMAYLEVDDDDDWLLNTPVL